MNAQMDAQTLREFFTADALSATSPLIVLTLGVLVLLTAEILPGAARLRPFLFVGSLIGALVCQVSILRGEGRLVLGETYAADAHSAGWGLLFIFSTFLAWAYGREYYNRSKAFLGEHDVLLLTTTIGMTMMAARTGNPAARVRLIARVVLR